MRFIQMFTGITVSFVLAACAAVQGYEGARLPNSETALITARSDSLVWIGVSVPGTRITHKLRLLPGYRCVNVEAAYGGGPLTNSGLAGNRRGEEFELCFQANANKTYDVKALFSCTARNRRGGCRREGWSLQVARIEDAESGEVLDVNEFI